MRPSTLNPYPPAGGTLSLAGKLALLLSLPLAGLVLLGAIGTTQKWQIKRDYAALQGNSAVLRQIGNLAHELQRERGRSAGFLNSQGAKFSTELRTQYDATDAQEKQLTHLLESFQAHLFGSDFENLLAKAKSGLASTTSLRAGVQAFTTTAAEATAGYSDRIAALLKVIVAMSHLSKDAAINDGISCYVNFLQAKEQTGIERAVLTGTFSLDRFTEDAFRRFSRALASQETYLQVFASFASPDQMEFCDHTIQGSAIERIAQFRQLAYQHSAEGKFGVAPTECFNAFTERIELMKRVEDRLANDYEAKAAAILQAAQHGVWVYSSLTLGTALITVIFGFLLMRSILKPVRSISDALALGSDQTYLAASQIATASHALADQASTQASALEETSASLEEISGRGRLNARHAAKAMEAAKVAHAAAEKGSAEVREMAESMKEIAKSGEEISQIIQTISHIAFQTNVLALNAAVEAARAGNAGLGFGVVADEVRTLAQRSAKAVNDTTTRIQHAVTSSRQGLAQIEKVTKSFETIATQIVAVDQLASEVATGSGEQSQGMEQINSAVGQMDQLTQANAATAEESSSAAMELTGQANSQREIVQDLMRLIVGGKQHLTPASPSTPEPASRPKLVNRTKGNRTKATVRTTNQPLRSSQQDIYPQTLTTT